MKRAIHAVIQFFFAALIEDWQKKPPEKKVGTVCALLMLLHLFGVMALTAFCYPSAHWIMAVSYGAWCALSGFAFWQVRNILRNFYGCNQELHDDAQSEQSGFRLEDEYPPSLLK